MKSRLLLCLTLFSAVGCGPLGLADKGPPETKDRLSAERIQHLVERPMQRVNEGRLSDGEAEFQRLVEEAREKHGQHSVEVADLYTSFGVELFREGSDESRQASRKYFQQAIPEFRAAFGEDHPEVAVALNDLASVEKTLSPDDPPAIVEDLLLEAMRIRINRLGQAHHESRATMTYLANVYALPAWQERKPDYFAQADSLYRMAMNGAARGSGGDSVTNGAAIRVRLAKLYARKGYERGTIELVNQALSMSENWPAKRRCDLIEAQLDELVLIMAKKGVRDPASAVRPSPEKSACSRLAQPNWLERILDALGLR